LFGHTSFLSVCRLEAWRVDGLFSHTSFLFVGRLEAWGVDGLFSDTDVLSVCRLESRRINGSSVETNLFARYRGDGDDGRQCRSQYCGEGFEGVVGEGVGCEEV
jgi:hypothetical protein